MSHSPLFDNLARAIRVALFCDRQQISTSQGLEWFAAIEEAADRQRLHRRELLALGGLGIAGAIVGHMGQVSAAPKPKSSATVGIVGAGFAGLTCAYELQRNGILATLHEASDRVGGRCYSLDNNFFPGQVAERGGEFIDNLHKTLIGYAREFGLTLEDVNKQPGEVFYYFNGQRYPESVVVDEFRALVSAMQADLRTLSGEPSADSHTEADVRLDRTSLQAYLDSRQAGNVVKAAIKAAYEAEYGLPIAQQSCLNFLLFIHADRRSKFTPFGVFSDERYHVVEGNDKITQGLRDRLQSPVKLGMKLLRVRKTGTNQIELTFQSGSRTTTATYNAVVLAIPFTTLRQVELDPSLGLPAWKVQAIQQLGYGNNAKMMLGFNGRPWLPSSNGSSYSDLPNHQSTWETNPVKATSTQAILTDYSSGDRALRLKVSNVQAEADRFLTDLNRVYPGSKAVATKINGQYRVHLEPWPSNPLTKGSYTCYTPGQFTSIAGNEGKPVGNLHFAGEHANSFYEWQGFMEGAALSGIQAANEILQDLKVGRL
ncbi:MULTISPECIES: FAD-dependent oxidoreductase [Trichocoleus]|uniref:FAD-dependent oxidoreductase n=1 Tax=Trichocoleus desertorum GB2-A4 TaxID=2933944 RepID=A0ABV0J938_9CYAN|nr:FAD-dependent oxidoreductase [Trichocoleus sp. FACHB-46]MBD1864673.1 FAD-dependent oxidoreductase [Trichocoleus sp. FACHB-46]